LDNLKLKQKKMTTTKHIAKHFREIYFGGNWTASNLKEHIKDVTWEQATTQVYGINTMATLVFHIHYYVHETLKILRGGELDAHDKFSFDHPPIQSQEDWDIFLEQVWADAESFANLVEQLPDNTLWQNIAEEKHGIYYRNLHGIIEHAHYHLGQIVLVKKILLQMEES